MSACARSNIAHACTRGQRARPMGVLQCESARKGGSWVFGGDAATIRCSVAACSSPQQTTWLCTLRNLAWCDAGRDWAGARETHIHECLVDHFSACSKTKPRKAAICVMVGAHALVVRVGGLPCQGRNCTPKCAASAPPGRNAALTCFGSRGVAMMARSSPTSGAQHGEWSAPEPPRTSSSLFGFRFAGTDRYYILQTCFYIGSGPKLLAPVNSRHKDSPYISVCFPNELRYLTFFVLFSLFLFYFLPARVYIQISTDEARPLGRKGAKWARCGREAGAVRARCGRGAGAVRTGRGSCAGVAQARCGRGAGAVRDRCGRGAGGARAWRGQGAGKVRARRGRGERVGQGSADFIWEGPRRPSCRGVGGSSAEGAGAAAGAGSGWACSATQVCPRRRWTVRPFSGSCPFVCAA